MTRLIRSMRELSPLTRGLALFALANIVVVNLLVIALPSPSGSEPAIRTAYHFLLFRAGTDSWQPMSQAWDFLRSGGSGSVFDHVYYDLGNKFQYPLTSLLPLEVEHAALRGDFIRFGPLNLLSWLAVWGTAIMTALIFDRACREHLESTIFRGSSRTDRLARAAIAIALSITFYPIVKAFTSGNIQTWIDCAFAVTVWLWMCNRKTEAGFVSGLVCLIKPQIALLLLWAALRRQWGFAAGFAGVVVVGSLAAVAMYGVSQNFDYVSFLSFAGRHGESYWPNQSANGLLHHLLSNGSDTTFRVDGVTRFAPYDPVVYAGTLATSVLLIVVALFWRRDEHDRAGTIDLLVASLTITIASPIAWQHHYGVLMPMYAVLLPAMLRWHVFGAATLTLLAASYVMTSNVFYAATYAPEGPLSIVESYLFAGALVALVSLYALRHAAATETSAVTQIERVPKRSGAPATT